MVKNKKLDFSLNLCHNIYKLYLILKEERKNEGYLAYTSRTPV